MEGERFATAVKSSVKVSKNQRVENVLRPRGPSELRQAASGSAQPLTEKQKFEILGS